MPRSFLITKKSRKGTRRVKEVNSSPRIPLSDKTPSAANSHAVKIDNGPMPCTILTSDQHQQPNRALWRPALKTLLPTSQGTQYQWTTDETCVHSSKPKNEYTSAPGQSNTHAEIPLPVYQPLEQHISHYSHQPSLLKENICTNSANLSPSELLDGGEVNQQADDSGYRTSSLYSPVSSCDLTDDDCNIVVHCSEENEDSDNHIDSSAECVQILDSSHSDHDDISVGEEGETSFTCEPKYTKLIEDEHNDSTSAAYKSHLDKVVNESIASKVSQSQFDPIIISPMNQKTNTLVSSLPVKIVSDGAKWNKGHIENILRTTTTKETQALPPYVPVSAAYPSVTSKNQGYLNEPAYAHLPVYSHIPPSHYSPYMVQERYHPYHYASARTLFPTYSPPVKPVSPTIKTGYEFLPHLNVPYGSTTMVTPHTTSPKQTVYKSLELSSRTEPQSNEHSDLSPKSPGTHHEPIGYSFSSDGDSPKYVCQDCNKSYSTYSGLAKHRQFHCSAQSPKEFSCKHCNKTYTSLGALKMHIRTHTLPCKCQICGKAFSRPWLLQGHIRTHTGEKPFSCQHCNRAFADRSNLRAHLQTHSEVKKYSCKHCTKTFSRMSLLMKHEDGGCNAI